MKAFLAYLATALTFLGMLLLAFQFFILGWTLRLISDIVWIVWGLTTKPQGWTAVVFGEFLFAIADCIGLIKCLDLKF